MTHQDLVKHIRCGLFADRGTDLAEAYAYVTKLAESSDEPVVVLTAVHVMLNTIANVLGEQTNENL